MWAYFTFLASRPQPNGAYDVLATVFAFVVGLASLNSAKMTLGWRIFANALYWPVMGLAVILFAIDQGCWIYRSCI